LARIPPCFKQENPVLINGYFDYKTADFTAKGKIKSIKITSQNKSFFIFSFLRKKIQVVHSSTHLFIRQPKCHIPSRFDYF